jgi:tetratricopeptide (TPR) repeat protein
MSDLTASVWQEKVIIPTYETGKPDKNPMFFEKRVYQGSSGVVYPNPIIEKIADEKHDKEYTGLFLENKYLKIMILPELGGRIQMAYDKIKQRHFIYYNQVIKPALVGLTGPWISGGIEFNWPQHHRPSTFEPVDYTTSENSDGSKTVWVNEVERMFHTKGMVGFTLHPDKAYIEIKVELYNRSKLPQTFLWWANPAVKVNDYYQSVFPPDVNAVFDHGKRDVSDFPIATGTYYKVDYSPGTDISMYKNIPVPTSYMAINSDYDFVGGYEHDTKAGLLHVANHHVSPGKKQWTWGYGDFGQAWDRNLTDEDGPYIELMTGVFTDNQPDFTWLMPNEEKSFTQYFMPYQQLGVVKNASKDILLSADKAGDKLTVKVYATSVQKNITLSVFYLEQLLFEETITVSPENIFAKETTVNKDLDEKLLLITIKAPNGIELLRYEPSTNKKNELPQPASPALPPNEIKTTEQLFLTGQHLEQYRHATYNPVDYYEKALKRDATDMRNNNALGKWYLRKGQFAKSELYFKKAIETSIQRNPNPYNSEPYYNLGLCLLFLDRQTEAYEAFYKATWSNAWKDSSYLSLAQIDMARANYSLAIEHAGEALNNNKNNSKAYVIKAAAYRKLNQTAIALHIANEALNFDRFNLAALFEKILIAREDKQDNLAETLQQQLLLLSRKDERNLLEYALDYAAAGLYNEAGKLLQLAITAEGNNPMVLYSLGWFSFKAGDEKKAQEWLKKAAAANPYLCFPNRLEEIGILQLAIKLNPADSKAPYYLGNLFYDKRQYTDAITYWEQSVKLDKTFPTVLRNLGIAYFNKENNAEKALSYFEKAFSFNPADARVLMELDQLYKRLNREPGHRLTFLNNHLNVATQRDDVYLERVSLFSFLGEHETALQLLQSRQFHPWEGGEGKVSGQYVTCLVQLARKCIEGGIYEKAIGYLQAAQIYPHNLGEGKLYGTQENDIFYWLGCAYAGLNQPDAATEFFTKATIGLDEPSAAVFYNDQQPDKIFYQGLAHKKLGNGKRAVNIFNKLIDYGQKHGNDEVKIDYFAVSLPNLLIFEDDLNLRNQIHTYFIQGLGYLGLEEPEKARDLFNKVLELDASHSGSKEHLEMTQQSLNQLSN